MYATTRCGKGAAKCSSPYLPQLVVLSVYVFFFRVYMRVTWYLSYSIKTVAFLCGLVIFHSYNNAVIV